MIPLTPGVQHLERALAVVQAACDGFAADPRWSAQLLAAPWVRGVKPVTPQAIELSVVLTTAAGRQWETQRALLRQLVVALQGEGVELANSSGPTTV